MYTNAAPLPLHSNPKMYSCEARQCMIFLFVCLFVCCLIVVLFFSLSVICENEAQHGSLRV